MLPGHAIQPCEVLDINLIRIGITSLTSNKCSRLAVDKTSNFPFAFPFPSKQAEELAHEPLPLCQTFGVPKVIRCDGG